MIDRLAFFKKWLKIKKLTVKIKVGLFLKKINKNSPLYKCIIFIVASQIITDIFSGEWFYE